MKCKKLAAAVLAVILVFALCSACAPKEKPNEAPVLTGVQETRETDAGKVFDALAGVTATDTEDGDITDKITVTSVPTLIFTDGKTTPTESGDYELVYSVTDSAGKTTEAYTTLTVHEVLTETTYRAFDFTEGQRTVTQGDWFVMPTAPAAATAAFQEGRLELDITNAGEAGWQMSYAMAQFAAEANTKYTVKVYASASQAVNFNFVVANGDTPLGGDAGAVPLYNAQMTTEMQVFEASLTSPETLTNAWFRLELGKNEGNADAYKIYIEKIELYTTSGVDHATVNKAFTFDEEGDEAIAARGDYDTTSAVGRTQDGELQFTINYPETVNLWEIALIVDTKLTTVTGEWYKLTMDIDAQTEQYYKFVFGTSETVEPGTWAGYQEGQLAAGANSFSLTFQAISDLTDEAKLIFQLGVKPSAEATANVLKIDNIQFFTVEKNESTEKKVTQYSPYDNSLYAAFNGSDESFDGVGRLYGDEEKLVYHIEQLGTVDYYNKLFLSKVLLEGMAKYRIDFTIKASTDTVKGLFLMNKSDAAYDPDIVEGLTLGTTEKTYSLTMKNMVMQNFPYDFIFQFGGADNAGKAPFDIIITEITLYKLV